jgi:hypothetical protein
MPLFCLLCVILVLGSLLFRRELAAFLTDVFLAIRGVRAPTRRLRPRDVPTGAPPPPQLGSVPPPPVVTRPRS